MPTNALLNKMRTDAIVATREASAPQRRDAPVAPVLRAVPDLPEPEPDRGPEPPATPPST